MKRSLRSIPTGPGSRGGRWGAKPPAAYWREYRATHPEYRERDNARRAEARRAAQLRRDREAVDRLARLTVVIRPLPPRRPLDIHRMRRAA